ncbi:hypothetical protein B0H16DRAFT_1011022 [Mycena metata]|uniref:Uncharacterized protein n=1 Tax=Mycena metata TaxID=1033252 RepID=A0AAD7IK40_9AGAR|nr:hypothetical protein B0H16DRAFT_1011022 [Mycena metata]
MWSFFPSRARGCSRPPCACAHPCIQTWLHYIPTACRSRQRRVRTIPRCMCFVSYSGWPLRCGRAATSMLVSGSASVPRSDSLVVLAHRNGSGARTDGIDLELSLPFFLLSSSHLIFPFAALLRAWCRACELSYWCLAASRVPSLRERMGVAIRAPSVAGRLCRAFTRWGCDVRVVGRAQRAEVDVRGVEVVARAALTRASGTYVWARRPACRRAEVTVGIEVWVWIPPICVQRPYEGNERCPSLSQVGLRTLAGGRGGWGWR